MSLIGISSNTQIALLLTSSLRQRGECIAKPLTRGEFHNFVKALDRVGLKLDDIFYEQSLEQLVDYGSIDLDRIKALLSRGLALAVAVEKWAAQGIWVVGWGDALYPVCYKERLGDKAPPVLYGIGEISFLSNGGLAIVGSRNADESSLLFAREVAKLCVEQNIQVVSGAARGIDYESMSACIGYGGIALGVLSDSLSRRAVIGEFRDAIINGKLTLVSSCEPEARFTVANAMDRNKLIYTLANFALVVNSDYDRGGTWAGAVENLRSNWTPLFVRKCDNAPEGNERLIERGAYPIGESEFANKGIVELMQSIIDAKKGVVTKDNGPRNGSKNGTLSLFPDANDLLAI